MLYKIKRQLKDQPVEWIHFIQGRTVDWAENEDTARVFLKSEIENFKRTYAVSYEIEVVSCPEGEEPSPDIMNDPSRRRASECLNAPQIIPRSGCENVSEREKILLEAIKCVTKDRNATHGNPEDNFAIIANFWTDYLRPKYGIMLDLTSKDVAVMMVLMKTSRIITSPDHQDHWVDICGYAACGGGIK